MLDFHIHTTLSCDGRSTLDEVCRRAMEIGLRAVCFTEHMEFDPNDSGYGYLSYEEYSARVDEARCKYSGKLTTFKGVEADYQSRFEEKIRDWLADKELDFVLGSVHYVDGEIFSEPMLAKRDIDETYVAYLEQVRLSAESGLFSAIAHLDYIKRFTGDVSYLESSERLRPFLEEALLAIIANGAALEVNTKGLVGKSRDYRPSLNIVRFYKHLGGTKVTIGSDAHDCYVLGTGVGKLRLTCAKMGLEVVTTPKTLKRNLLAHGDDGKLSGSRQKGVYTGGGRC